MNTFQYYSPRAEELPADFVQDMIKILNEKHKYIIKCRLKDIDCSYHEQELKSIIRFLEQLDLHPCYSMVGYRGTYHFPSWEDCEMWEDWIWQCAD